MLKILRKKMDIKKRVIVVRNYNPGGVKTIIEDIKKLDKNIQILILNNFLSNLILLKIILFSKNTIINFHGWIWINPIYFLKKIKIIKPFIFYSFHSDPKKELTNFRLLEKVIEISQKISFVSDYHFESAKLIIKKSLIAELEKKSVVIMYKLNITKNIVDNYQNFNLTGKKIGLITRLSKEKGVEKICNALNKDYQLIIWGDGPDRNYLKQKFKTIKFVGSSSDFIRSLKSIDIFVFCSNWGVWGISLLEAVALGKRFIYPQNENWRDLFPKNSFQLSYDINKPETIKYAINNAINLNVYNFIKIRDKILNYQKENHAELYLEI